MNFIWRQSPHESALTRFGISELCFKKLRLDSDRAVISNKTHHHSEFEVHIITKGRQFYEIEGEEKCVDAGSFLLISPKLPHRTISFDSDSEKLVLLFEYERQEHFFDIPTSFTHAVAKTTPEIFERLSAAEKGAQGKTELSHILTENRLFEALVLLFRTIGLRENTEFVQNSKIPTALLLAIKFITDNIESAPTVGEVASYCHLSERQLSRIFLRYEDKTAFDFIRAKRIEHAKELLEDDSLSLCQISERMSFPSEYYFNQFFKSGYGMPPGAYRKMMK